ncbi:hypothetical protein BDN70DRAFT_364515 [Pholiota conissans]|uniref:Uncharacterized protein n=1 Tax=Pholiota conissans TaxID=109636 RepID=A0A9P6CUX8_9AGAR|nr:hypothetical protein BDN70DRAFT_364515 [Pholiota conissans]
MLHIIYIYVQAREAAVIDSIHALVFPSSDLTSAHDLSAHPRTQTSMYCIQLILVNRSSIASTPTTNRERQPRTLLSSLTTCPHHTPSIRVRVFFPSPTQSQSIHLSTASLRMRGCCVVRQCTCFFIHPSIHPYIFRTRKGATRNDKPRRGPTHKKRHREPPFYLAP